MILGIGIDITRTERIERAVQRWGKPFLDRIYTQRELSYCTRHKVPFPQLAARFAAKEAVIKALGGTHGMTLREIEISHDPDGKPIIIRSDAMARALAGCGASKIHLSLTHEREYAAAFVVLEA